LPACVAEMFIQTHSEKYIGKVTTTWWRRETRSSATAEGPRDALC